jgi:hypothetical protein
MPPGGGYAGPARDGKASTDTSSQFKQQPITPPPLKSYRLFHGTQQHSDEYV